MENKHKYLKRFLAFVLSAAMVITYMPTSLIAYAGDDSQSDRTVGDPQSELVQSDNERNQGENEQTPGPGEASETEESGKNASASDGDPSETVKEVPQNDNLNGLLAEGNDEEVEPSGDTTEEPVVKDLAEEWEVKYFASDNDETPVRVEKYEKTDDQVLGELPEGPEKDYATFKGWAMRNTTDIVTEETPVTGDMELIAQYDDMITIKFVTDDGELISRFTREEGQTIGTMPQDPFKEGSKFVKWVIQGTETEVTADTVVTDDMTIVAVFDPITIYEITIQYYYMIDGTKVEFDHDSYDLDGDAELPVEYNVPTSTKVDAEHDPTTPTYYASEPTVQVTTADIEAAEATGTTKIIKEMEYVEYTAQYDYVYVLKDLTGDGYTEIDRMAGVKGVLGSHVNPTVKEFAYANFERAEGGEVTQREGQEFKVYYTRKNFSLLFDTTGGSYVPTQNLPYGSTVNLNDIEPTKQGYDFAGWYTDENLETPADSQFTLEQDTTLYAKWTGKDVEYTVVYMKEKYDNATGTTSYVYDNSRKVTGTVGTTVVATGAPDLTNNINGYEKDAEKNATSTAVIAADGSTVLTCYYSLIRYTLVFNLGRYNEYHGEISMDGQQYHGSEYRVENVVLGQDISAKWPSSSNEVYSDWYYFYYWSGAGSYVTKRYELIWDNVKNAENGVMTYTANWRGSSENTDAKYWLQQPDGTYKVEDAYTQTGLNTTNLDPKNIDGYTQHNGNASRPSNSYPGSGNQITSVIQNNNGGYVQDDNRSGGNRYTYYEYNGHLYRERDTSWFGNIDTGKTRYNVTFKLTYNFYYDRAQYTIEYKDGGTRLKITDPIYFEADISGAEYNYTPEKPTGKEDYTWDGWYADSALQTQATFTTMPGNNVVVYAKWIPPQYTVTYDTQGGTGDFAPETVDKNKSVTFPGAPAKENYVFQGWYTEAEGGELYDWNAPVTADITLYARWAPKAISYTVRYLDKDNNNAPLFADKVVKDSSLEAGQTVTESANTLTGYRPDANSKDLQLGYNDEENVIIFFYSKKSDKTSYTVKYVDAETGNELHDPSTNEVDGSKVSVIVTPINITDYYPLEDEKELILTSVAENNVVIFEYAKYNVANITVNYLDMNGDPIPGKVPETKRVKVGESYDVPMTSPAGYKKHHSVDSNGVENKSHYKITEGGNLTINVYYQKRLTLTATNKTKTYDGEPLVSEGLGDVTADGLLDGHTLTEIQFDGSQTSVGRSKTTPKNAVVKAGDQEISTGSDGYYHVSYVKGNLTVTKASVVINVEPDRWNDGDPYDGTERTIGFRKIKEGGTEGVAINNAQFEALYGSDIRNAVKGISLSKTDAGHYTIPASQIETAIRALPAVFQNQNFDVTLNIRDGELTIPKRPIELKSVDLTKEYDGTALTNGDNSITVTSQWNGRNLGGWVGSEGATYKFTGSQLEVGTSANAFTYTLKEGTNPDNYDITKSEGTLSVTDRTTKFDVTITAASETATYDGQNHSAEGLTEGSKTIKIGDATFTVTAETSNPTKKDAGIYENKIDEDSVVIKDSANNVVTDQFNITAVDGTLTINRAAVTVTIVGANHTDNYDGEEHAVTGYTATSNNDLYSLEKVTFTPAEGADMTEGGEIRAKRTDAGTTNMGLAENQFSNADNNFNVTFDVTDGYQKIDPIDVTVTITGHNHTDQYDGQEHIVTGYDAKASTSLFNVESDINFSGTAEAKRTRKGTTNMGLTEDMFSCDNPNFATVSFTVVDGYQTITAKDKIVVTITGHNNTATYDGENHTVTGYDVQISDPLYTEADFKFTGTKTATRKDVGTTNMGLAASQFENTNEDFENVTFIVVDGYQTIEKANVTVTITGHNSTLPYDGTDHTVTGYDVTSISNNLYTESDFSFTGEATATREIVGTTNMDLKAEQFTNNNNNFGVTFSVTDGYQKIDPIDVTVTIVGNNSTVPYDGEAHTVTGYEATFSTDLYTTADFTFSGTASATRTDAGTTSMGLAKEQFTNTNSNFGTVTFNVTDGYQKINPIDVTVIIKGHTSSVDYDGIEHEVSGYDVEITNPLYKEADFTFTGTAKAARTNVVEGEDADGKTEMGLNEEQFTNKNNNFSTVTFTITDGYQEIRPIAVTVTIKGNTSSDDYDGEAHTVTGYTATANSTLYDVTKDFDFSGEAEATRTNVVEGEDADGKTEMGLKPADFTNTNTNFEDVTFDVTDGYQEIKPIEVTVTVVGNNSTDPYDGEAHTVTGYTATAKSTLYDVTKDVTFDGEATATRTNVVEGEDADGQTDMGLSADQFTNTNKNFKNVTFDVTDGYQKITPIDVAVTITGHNNTTKYDGKEHSVSGYDVAFSNDLYTETDFSFTGEATATRKNVGTTNMNLNAEQFANTNSNFSSVTFNVTDGYQTITAVDEVMVTITGHSNTADYDGNEHSVNGYDVAISDPLYKETDFTFSGAAEAARTNVVEGEDTDGQTDMGLSADQFTNTNKNFKKVTFKVTDGYQKITPINVTVNVVGNNSSDPYDGKAHTVTDYTATTESKLYDVTKDFTFSGEATATRTNVVEDDDADGKTDMGLSSDQFTNNNTNFKNVTFSITDGYQEITPIDVKVKITGNTSSVDYDGKEHTVEGYTATTESKLYDVDNDFTFSGKAEASRTNVVEGDDADGRTDMGLSSDQFTNTNKNFKAVSFEVTDGYQEIKPISAVVTITGHNDTTDYDGKEHSVSGYDAKADTELFDVKKDIVFSGTAEAARTDAGTTPMGLAANQFSSTNTNFADVTFNVTDGYQKIDPIDITVTITGKTSSVDYDGNAHTVNGYDAEASNKLFDVEKDIAFSGTDSATRTDVGKTNMGLAKDQFSNKNANFKTVTFEVTDGYQEIKPISVTVTITGHTSSVDYDGKEHKISGYEVEISNPLYKETDFDFSGTAEAARTNVVEGEDADGKTDMGLKADQFKNKNPNFGTVTFKVTDGYQEIKPIDVTVKITGHSNTATYDGETHSVKGYDVEIGNKLYKQTDFTFSGTAEASRKTVGTTKMNLAKEQFENKNTNFKTVTFDVTDGYQTIVPVDEVVVTIKGHTNSTDYDGTEHSVSGYDVQISDPLYKEADFTFNGKAEAKRKDAGRTDMGLKEPQFENTNENFAKVTFNITDGYQEIKPIKAKVTITGNKNTSDYDGKDHEVSGYTVKTSTPLYTEADFTFSGKAEAKRKDAGQTDMGLKESQFKNTNGNFSEVTFEIIDGYQKIDPIDATVTITGHTDSAVYNGKKHTVSGYDAKASSDLYDVSKDIEFTGNDTAERTDAGTTNMGLKAEQFANKNANFKTVTFVIKKDGAMTVTPLAVTVTVIGNSDEATYDGKPHTVTGYKATADSKLYDPDEDIVFSGNAMATRTNAGTTAMDLSASQFANSNNNFAVTFDVKDGSIKINPASINDPDDPTKPASRIKAEDPDDVIYNGSSQKQEIVVTDAEAGNDGTILGPDDITLSYSDDTTNVGEVTVTITAKEGGNYTGSFIKTYKILPKALTITADSARKEYDGTALIMNGYTEDGLADGDSIRSITITGSQTEVGSSKNVASDAKIINEEELDATANYNITYVDGTLTVDPLPEYDITYNLNGGEYNGSTANIVEIHEKGEVITIHPAPTREGYEFDYWEGSKHYPGDKYTVTGDHTFVAQWKVAEVTDDDDDDHNDDKDTSKGVKTGDDTNIPGAVGGFFASLAALFGAIFIRRRSNRDDA